MTSNKSAQEYFGGLEDYLSYLNIIVPETNTKSRTISLMFHYMHYDDYWDAMEQLRQTSSRDSIRGTYAVSGK